MEHSAQHRQPRPLASRQRLIGLAAATCLVAGATAIEAAPSGAQTAHSASSICSKVSAATVSSIVGYTVPAGVYSSLVLPATAKNDEIKSTSSVCTYGSDKSLADVEKDVILDIAVTSKPITESEIESNVVKTEKSSGAKYSISSYSGLGVPGYYLVVSIDGIKAETVAGITGNHDFAASVDSSKVTESTLGKLAKLAETL
jgi:hypothetical protein